MLEVSIAAFNAMRQHELQTLEVQALENRMSL
jgi:hypothetical protein